ncbi:helicase-associated domain-containing protein [Paenibacillus sp. DMB20]|uniref:helicase-associated domain-containing protein n=1 Tax=Paenibacillus sp. DMB20 TaxID=1642570 RepID=UPI0006998624|nr:helicase-associated domain-containing protein [Paenibacillus sp. DMB20]
MSFIQAKDVPGLSGANEKVLSRIWRAFAGQPFDDDKLKKLDVPPLCGAEVLVSFAELREEGWIKAVKKAWGERLYFIPEDRLPFLQEIFFTIPEGTVDVSADATEQEAKAGLALDLFNALVYVSRNEGLPLTSKGTVHKKHVSKLEDTDSGITGTEISRIGLRYAHEEAYPPRAAVLLDLMLNLGLVVNESHSLTLQEDALKEWLELPEEEMNRQLFQNMMGRYGGNQPESQHFRRLLCLESLKADAWHDVDRLLEGMEAAGMVRAERLPSLKEEARGWVRFLAGAGFADSGVSPGGSLLIRWKLSGRSLLKAEERALDAVNGIEGFLFVQPDYEVLVPPGTPFTVRWQLALCAERVSDDHMSVYRLTKSSVTSAADLGMSPGEVMRFIERQSASGVPENVANALEQWGREVGRTAFAEITVLQCETAEEAERIARHPKIAGRIHRLGPLFFAVQPDQLPEIRKLLTSFGLPPKRGVGGFGQISGLPESGLFAMDNGKNNPNRYMNGGYDPISAAGIVYSGRTVHFYEPDQEIPDKLSLFPGITKIPLMWTRDWRSYHSSTAREIMELALDWRAAVELGFESGKKKFIPKSMLRNPWRVLGELYEPESSTSSPAELSEEDWQEMKLQLPIAP